MQSLAWLDLFLKVYFTAFFHEYVNMEMIFLKNIAAERKNKFQ